MSFDWVERVDLCRQARVGDSDGGQAVETLATGSLVDMVGSVFLLPPNERGTIFIEGPVVGRLSIFQIIALSMRSDFARS